MAKGQKPKTQEQSATTVTKCAAIYIESFHRVPQEDIARFGEPTVIPLDVQERACRAYCERRGYSVFSVYGATKPPPDNVRLLWVLSGRVNSSSPDAPTKWRVCQQYHSRHPYYWVHNLLEEDTVDTVVQFRAVGPSGPMFPALMEAMGTSRSHLAQFEYASSWEIEPPTEKERLRYELVERFVDAESEEETRALIDQWRLLSAEIKREAQEAEMRAQWEREEALTAAQPRHYQVVISRGMKMRTHIWRASQNFWAASRMAPPMRRLPARCRWLFASGRK